MCLRALLFDLWPFENSTGPWEGLLFVNSTNITTNIETAVLSSVDLLHSPTITITVDILMINGNTISRITIVMITVDLSRVKTPLCVNGGFRGGICIVKWS